MVAKAGALGGKAWLRNAIESAMERRAVGTLRETLSSALDYGILRVPFDDEGGTVWTAPLRRERECHERRKAMVDVSKITQPDEEALSRAMFNARTMRLLPGQQTEMVFLAFEAPLLRLRPRSGVTSRPARTVAADLISFERAVASAGDEVDHCCVIEVKKDGGDDSLQYALLEAWSYAYLLASHCRQDCGSMSDEMGHAYKHYHGESSQFRISAVRFAVAAPEGYFVSQRDAQADMVSWEKQVRDASGSEDGVEVDFSGYLVVGEGGVADMVLGNADDSGAAGVPELRSNVDLRRCQEFGKFCAGLV